MTMCESCTMTNVSVKNIIQINTRNAHVSFKVAKTQHPDILDVQCTRKSHVLGKITAERLTLLDADTIYKK